jgi:hypothetical protein
MGNPCVDNLCGDSIGESLIMTPSLSKVGVIYPAHSHSFNCHSAQGLTRRKPANSFIGLANSWR